MGFAGLALFVAVLTGSPQRAPDLEDRPDPVAVGAVELDASPERVYAAIMDLERWSGLFTDAREVVRLGGGRDDALVRFDSEIFGQELTIGFENLPKRLIRFHLIDSSMAAELRGEYALQPVDGGRRTRLEARLELQVGAPIGWLIPARSLARVRRAKLRHDLADLARRFSPLAPAEGAPP